VLHAVGDVIAQHFLFQAPQSRANRRNLRHNVDAVAILLDHPGDAAHLTLYSIQALGACFLDVLPHAAYIPPGGIVFNRRTRGADDGFRRSN
jgi:hypothetical protein